MNYQYPSAGDPTPPTGNAWQDEPMPVQPRRSALAVTSLVLACCCCIPGLGGVAFALGAISLMVIANSNGRIVGKGLAIGGMIGGVFVSAVWIASCLMLVTTGQIYLAATLQAVSAVQKAEPAALRQLLAPAPNAGMTDAQLVAFCDAVNAKAGKLSRSPTSVVEYIGEFMNFQAALERNRKGSNWYASVHGLPMPVVFEKGEAIVLIDFDQSTVNPSTDASKRFDATFLEVTILFPDGEVLRMTDFARPDRRLPAPPPPTLPSSPAPPTPTPTGPKPAAPRGG